MQGVLTGFGVSVVLSWFVVAVLACKFPRGGFGFAQFQCLDVFGSTFVLGVSVVGALPNRVAHS